MDTGERLAAYLSGDLDPDERTALEAELAGDPALRSHLDRIRHSDARLASLEDPPLPDGFQDRLRDRLRPELDAVLGDELAARRARRAAPRWLPAVGAAAAIAVVVAGGIAVVQPGGGDDAAESAAGTDQRVTSDAGDTDEEAADGAFDTMMAPEAGPRIVSRGRTVTAEDLEALGQDPDVQAGLAADTVQADPEGAAGAWAAGLGGDADLAEQEAAPQAEGDAGAVEDDAAMLESETEAAGGSQRASAPAVISGDVTDADREAVARCLPVLYEAAAAPVVPLYAELAEDDDGNPVVVYVALAPDADGAYERLEVWMVDRETCEPRLFVQGEAQPVDRNAP